MILLAWSRGIKALWLFSGDSGTILVVGKFWKIADNGLRIEMKVLYVASYERRVEFETCTMAAQ